MIADVHSDCVFGAIACFFFVFDAQRTTLSLEKSVDSSDCENAKAVATEFPRIDTSRDPLTDGANDKRRLSDLNLERQKKSFILPISYFTIGTWTSEGLGDDQQVMLRTIKQSSQFCLHLKKEMSSWFIAWLRRLQSPQLIE